MFRDVDFTTTSIPGFLQQYLINQKIQIKSWRTDTILNKGTDNGSEDILEVNMNLKNGQNTYIKYFIYK